MSRSASADVPGRVAVVGGGFAGCAAALRLARDGAQVTVFEAVEDPGPVGAGILLQPTGAAVLQQLGVYDHVAWRGTPVRALHARTASGFELFELPYALEREDIHGLGLHRGVLFEALFTEVQITSAIDLRLGCMVVDAKPAQAGAGAEVIDDEGRRHGPFDLVVVADGARSEIRRHFPTYLDQAYPWGALWFVAEDPDRLFPDVLEQVVEGSRHMLGFLPTGRGPVRVGDPDPHDDPPLTSIFWSVRCDQEEAWRHEARRFGLHRWKETILRFEPRAEPLLRQIEDHRQVLFAAYRDVRMSRWWHPLGDAHLVFIGDAAHAMSPQLGQGSNLALIDAEALADAMAEAASVEEGLRAYQAARRAHLGYYGWVNRAVTPFFQSSSHAMGWLRDVGFPLACKVPGVRRLMVRTMAGMKRGLLFDEPMPLPAPVAARADEPALHESGRSELSGS